MPNNPDRFDKKCTELAEHLADWGYNTKCECTEDLMVGGLVSNFQLGKIFLSAFVVHQNYARPSMTFDIGFLVLLEWLLTKATN